MGAAVRSLRDQPPEWVRHREAGLLKFQNLYDWLSVIHNFLNETAIARKWRERTHWIALGILALLTIARSIHTSGWGLDLHHDYFSVNAGHYLNMGLAPNRQVYTHYGPIDAVVKSVMLRLSEGRLVGAKQLTAVMDATAAIALSMFLYPGRRIKKFLLTASIAWLGWEPFSFPDPNKFGGHLEYMAEWSEKVPKLAWSSDVALVLTCLMILATTYLIVEVAGRMNKTADIWSHNTRLLLLASAIGSAIALTFLTKFSIGISMALAILASMICGSQIAGNQKLFCRTTIIIIASAIATTCFVFVDIVGIGGFKAYFQQLSAVSSDFSGSGGTLALVSLSSTAALRWALNIDGILLIISSVLALLMLFKSEQTEVSPARTMLLGAVIAIGWSLQVALKIGAYTINAISAAAFAACVLYVIISPTFFSAWKKIDYEAKLRLSTLGWFSLFSLTQVMPISDGTHVWWASLPLLLFVAACSEILISDGNGKLFIRSIIAGVAIAGVTASIATTLSMRPMFIQITGNSFLTGVRYSRSNGRRRADYALSALQWIKENPQGTVLSLTPQEPLLDLLASNQLSADLQRCVGGPYFKADMKKINSSCLKEILIAHNNSILLAAADPKDLPASLGGIPVKKVYVNGHQYGMVVLDEDLENRYPFRGRDGSLRTLPPLNP